MQPINDRQPKLVWVRPELTIHGSVAQLTEKTVNKTLGLGDDFASTIQTVKPGQVSLL